MVYLIGLMIDGITGMITGDIMGYNGY